jgi:hypothetical protein
MTFVMPAQYRFQHDARSTVGRIDVNDGVSALHIAVAAILL